MDETAGAKLWFYFQNALLVAIPTSYLVLRWYRTQVARAMRQRSEVSAVAATSNPPAPETHGAMVASGPELAASTVEQRALRRLCLAYGVGTSLAAALEAAFFLRGSDVTPLRALGVWYAYLWLLAPTLAALLALPQRRAATWFAAYLATGFVAMLVWSAFNLWALGHAKATPMADVIRLLELIALQAWLPYLIILASVNRKLRSISTLVFPALLVFSYSMVLLSYAVIASMDVQSVSTPLLSVGGANYPRLLFFVTALPVGFAGWNIMRWLARGFQAKAFSDVQLAVDAWWLIAVIYAAVLGSISLPGWSSLLMLLVFPAYRIPVEWVLRLDPAASLGGTAGRRLLLLRVFGFRRRSEALFDSVAQRWRLVGSVRLIAGSDLSGRTVDPGDLISFLGGRLKDQFVRNDADLSRKLARIDDLRDPDGRFRVNEFFCFENAWKPTLQALLRRSDVVLMDLRGFSAQSKGCQFELEQLAAAGLLRRTLLVVDDSTDPTLLQASLPAGESPGIAKIRTGGLAESEQILQSLRQLSAAD